jgi:hypothetical protein
MSLEGFLVEVMTESIDAMTASAEDPTDVLRQAAERLRGSPVTAADIAGLVEHAHHSIGPVLDRSAPHDPRVLIAASASLVAALALLHQSPDTHEISGKIAQALGTLIRLAAPDTGPTPNQLLMLIRDI